MTERERADCSAFEAGGDIDAITKDIVAFDQHVAKVDTNSELHPPIVRDINVPFRRELLDRHGALDRGDDGGKLNGEALIAAGMTTRATGPPEMTVSGMIHGPRALSK